MHAHTEETVSLRRCAVRSIALLLALHLFIFSCLHSSLAREPLRWEKGLAPCPARRPGRGGASLSSVTPRRSAFAESLRQGRVR